MPQKITLNEALTVMKTLKARHAELIGLRNASSTEDSRYYGERQPATVKKPLYDLKEADKIINGLAREMRVLDMAIKRTNAATEVQGYEFDDAVLGELK